MGEETLGFACRVAQVSNSASLHLEPFSAAVTLVAGRAGVRAGEHPATRAIAVACRSALTRPCAAATVAERVGSAAPLRVCELARVTLGHLRGGEGLHSAPQAGRLPAATNGQRAHAPT